MIGDFTLGNFDSLTSLLPLLLKTTHAEVKPVDSLTRREAHASCLLTSIAMCIVNSVLF